MNRKSIAAALVLVASAGAALADDIGIENNPFTATKSRTEVLAELQQHRAARVNVYADDYNPLATFRSATTREEVRAGVPLRSMQPQGEIVAGQPFNAQ